MLQTDLLAGLTAVVTGGSQGLGLATVQALASHGARIFILDLKEAQAHQAAAALPITAHTSGEHGAFLCDVRKDQDRKAAIQTIIERSGRIDVLVNNAGIQYHAPGEAIDEEKWRDLFETNVHAVMFMSRDVAPYMLKQGSGSIINIGSLLSVLGMPRRTAYGASKTAVIGITRSLGVEWAGRGLRVNAICPGYHKTPLLQEYIDKGLVDEERIRTRIPMGRLGPMEAIGNAAVFLASPLSSYITGQYLLVDGGYSTFGAPEDASS